VSEGNGIRQPLYLTLLSLITATRDASRTKPEHAETGQMSITLHILWSPRPCRAIGNKISRCQLIAVCVQGSFFLLQRPAAAAGAGEGKREEATEDLFQLEASGRGMCQHMPSNRLLWVRDKAHASVRVGHDLICVKDGDVEFLRELHELREHLPEVLLPH